MMSSDLEQIGELVAGAGVGGVSVLIVRAAWATVRERISELRQDRDALKEEVRYWRDRALEHD